MVVKSRGIDARVSRLMTEAHLTVSVCESCTGGMLGSVITSFPGSSRYFVGGIIAYSDRVKKNVVGVKETTLERYGAVSAEVGEEMARGVRRMMASDVGVAITGIAGPGGGTVQKPVGLVYIAVAVKRRTVVRKLSLSGSRSRIRKTAVDQALMMLEETVNAYCVEE